MNETTQSLKDRTYAILLLLGCIDNLSRELSLHTDTDPELIATKALFSQSTAIQYKGGKTCIKSLENQYGWLIDQVENLIY